MSFATYGEIVGTLKTFLTLYGRVTATAQIESYRKLPLRRTLHRPEAFDMH